MLSLVQELLHAVGTGKEGSGEGLGGGKGGGGREEGRKKGRNATISAFSFSLSITSYQWPQCYLLHNSMVGIK